MSFVSVVGRENFITVVTDGLVTDSNTGNEVKHNYKKFSKISDKQFVAYGGNQGIAEAIKEALPFSDVPYDLKGKSEEIHEKIAEISYDEARVTCAIGGVNEKGEIEFYSFSNDPDEEFYSFSPKGDKISFTFLNSTHVNDIDLRSKFQEFLRQTGDKTANRIINGQKKMNDFVAAIDPTVNRLTFELTIRKS